MKLYCSQRGGSNCGYNLNAIRIFRVTGSNESIRFMAVVVNLAIRKYGIGLSGDIVCTNLGEVTFRYASYTDNLIAKKALIKEAKAINNNMSTKQPPKTDHPDKLPETIYCDLCHTEVTKLCKNWNKCVAYKYHRISSSVL